MPGRPRRGTALEIFRVFLRLGLTSFGGPVAHLGYFREEFVRRRGWLDEARFAHLLAICQFLPGPASSQLGVAIGLLRGGWRGAAAAFAGFTLPSALLMVAFAALGDPAATGYGAAAIHGLKLVAVAIVAHALLGMARTLAPDGVRRAIAIGAALLLLLGASPWLQLVVIALGALTGLWACRPATAPRADGPVPHGRGPHAAVAFALFGAGLLFALLAPRGALSPGSVFAAFYRAGALVFGGGHVVLPLLQQAVVAPAWVSPDAFLSGYGAAQALPGPMFSLAAFLGARMPLPYPAGVGATVALLGIFLPGFLLLAAVLPVWSRLVAHERVIRSMAGANAAVVGVLAAAFVDPVGVQGLRHPVDVAIALIAVLLVGYARRGALLAVGWCVAAALAAAALGGG